MQHNALCIQGMVERIRNVHRAIWRGCPDLADSPSCFFSLVAQRQTLGGLGGGRGAAASLAPSSLGQQRVRLPPTRSSSARPRRPPEESLGAAVGLGVAHPVRSLRLSRPGGHRSALGPRSGPAGPAVPAARSPVPQASQSALQLGLRLQPRPSGSPRLPGNLLALAARHARCALPPLPPPPPPSVSPPRLASSFGPEPEV